MNGILIVNKQKGYTSHDVVNKVKKIVKEKVGHTIAIINWKRNIMFKISNKS